MRLNITKRDVLVFAGTTLFWVIVLAGAAAVRG